ncbi:MAG: carboxylating nicotinate-nucleotide diphosphorylase [Bacteroidia bacterium]|nr:carboxylating nicotinate-nucleotide diphosphorylase [Bacteroidia bacterium]MCX7764622.1 carboxylating nicotinate-nucleotide diphosphorylase [Bacteroidia bacterium]MDW8058100.1 carboxylating nicotinate-nucleotide diphosphorylase [Bacteroidia bacterium]
MRELEELLREALAEDLDTRGDITSQAVDAAKKHAVGRCIVKKTGIIAGVSIAERVYKIIDSSVKFYIHLGDGAFSEAGSIAFEVYGNAYTLLTGERLVLNLLQRLSGIATLTRRYVEAIAGTNCEVLDTRKTTPLWRALEKWAVTLGGGKNHRFGLYDQFLIKDNHIDLVGGVAPAIEAVLRYREKQNLFAPIVVEVRNLPEIHQALKYAEHIDRLLLDNFSPEQVARAVEYIGGQLPVEVSGGITPENARAYAEAGARYISAGALTHSAPALDISLKIQPI